MRLFSFSCKFLINIYKEVGSLNSIPEVEILLTELKVLQVEMLDKLLTDCIQKCKNPTPSRCSLVCDWFDFFNLIDEKTKTVDQLKKRYSIKGLPVTVSHKVTATEIKSHGFGASTFFL